MISVFAPSLSFLKKKATWGRIQKQVNPHRAYVKVPNLKAKINKLTVWLLQKHFQNV